MIIRDEQLDAMREALQNPTPWDRAGRMVQDLEDLGFFERGTPELETLLDDFRRQRALAKGVAPEKALRTLVAEEIEQALGFGIRTELLLLHFVGFTFRHGLDWARGEAVSTLLARLDLDEDKRLSKVRAALKRR